ncbi:MAG: hypothetical protein ABS45_00350 [Comamonas sp. SCN 65-56]|uniref:UvrD-helicase domain-containing protein n=1 Tax=Comamonas sp. SCN 65-56 TaxID=1660095 RepID=UPI00086D691A|nr:UvrD-helicase domain-containing protein [Comamonas sp. SCN 65-56]ODS93853.1 MAG: hypothetical protein ABS45_00350 [Comamonas sp. SCN 65-56]
MSLTFISAGAGSGKTHTLMQTLGGLLESAEIRASGVIATTFTKKAATELRERVRQHLLGAGRVDLANAMGQARIGTVNSVCGSLLQRFAFEAGMATRQQVLDEAQTAQLVREAIEMATSSEQAQAVSDLADRLGIQEWSKDIEALVAQARGNDIDPASLPEFARRNADDLLAHFPAPLRTTLTDDLATQMRRTLPELRAAAGKSTVKKTQEYVTQLEQFAHTLGQGVAPWSKWVALSKQAPEKGLLPLSEPIQMLARACDAHPQLHADIRDYLQRMFGICAEALEHYRARKLALGVVDFTDQEHLLLKLLDDPDVAAVLRDELDLLLVDEFQDTSPIQLALFLKLSSLARHTYWVGDIKQAIYGFRGSDTELMQAIVAALPGMGGTSRILNGSWRSRPALVDLANQIFVPAFAPMLAAEQVALEPRRPETTANPALCRWKLGGQNVDEISESLAGGVQRLLASGLQIPAKGTETLGPLKASDVAILCRSNDAVTRVAVSLRRAGVAAATAQPGLLATPEATLALACLRRLNDPADTVATAEILSLADGLEPEDWLADRLAYLQQGGRRSAWCESGEQAHPLVALLAALRSELPLLTPHEALRRVMAACDLPKRVLRWQQDQAVARTRLANLDALLGMAAQYEDSCRGTRQAATISGLLLWLRAQAETDEDALAQPGVDAVRVLTHHGAKGLEWPVVILTDLDKEPRSRLWGISTLSPQGVDAASPLRGRFIRYWPWPFGKQASGIAVKDAVDASDLARAFANAALAEEQRLLYVSMTRPREILVLALKDKAKTQAWLDGLGAPWLLEGDEAATALPLPAGSSVPCQTWQLEGPATQVAQPDDGTHPLHSPSELPAREHLPLFFNPSGVAPSEGRMLEQVQVGERITVATQGVDWGVLGSAIHACLAASFTDKAGAWLSEPSVARVLGGFQVGAQVEAAAVLQQIRAFHAWMAQCWPGCTARAEVPVKALLPNGQILNGRIDLLLDTPQGFILIDHKSSPHESRQWGELAGRYQGQLAAYADAIERATGHPVLEQWLWLAVAGGAVRCG